MKDELLVRAAQANGHAYPWTMPNGFGERPWNPLTNNEDALVLAVRIGLQVTAYPMYDEPKHSVIVRKPVWDHDAQEGDGVEVVEPYGTDALAATRRAITMCAAELARRKTPNWKLTVHTGVLIDRLRAALAEPEAEPPRDEWRPASEPPEDDRDVVVWCAQERRAVHGMYVRRYPPVVGLVDGWVAPDASKLTHWRDVTPPTTEGE